MLCFHVTTRGYNIDWHDPTSHLFPDKMQSRYKHKLVSAYSNWHCWYKRQSLNFKILMESNTKNLAMFIQVVFSKGWKCRNSPLLQTHQKAQTCTKHKLMWVIWHTEAFELQMKKKQPISYHFYPVRLYYWHHSSLKKTTEVLKCNFPWDLLTY